MLITFVCMCVCVCLCQISDAAGSMKTSQVAQSNPFKQEMLSSSECYILDNGADGRIFLWKGESCDPVLVLFLVTNSNNCLVI